MGAKKAMAKLRRLLTIGLRRQVYLVIAVTQLARARIEFQCRRASSILKRLQDRSRSEARNGSGLDIDGLAWALRVAAGIVPWRSDCLIQSMAADRWLRKRGIVPSFKLGVVQGPEGQILGHAWIELDGRVLTGGASVDEYRLLISS